MFYLLSLLLFIILYYIFVKLLSSLVKGCLMAVFVLLLVTVIFLFVRSASEPVEILGRYEIDNFEVTRISK